MKNTFKQIIADFHNNPIKETKERDLKIDINCNKVISIIWPRRAGKSYYLFGIIEKLLLSWINKENIIYINFEDERLDIEGNKLQVLIDAYLELYPNKDIRNSYFFFDEIQNISGREKFIRRIYDEWVKNICITGSNAKLLSKEIATSLRGRGISYELLPLSFTEFLRFKDQKLNIYTTTNKAKILRLQQEFITWGWFPEIIKLDKELKVKVLQEYFDVMIYNDIIERYKAKDTTLLKQFIKLLLQSTSKEFSINKIGNLLRSIWFSFDKNMLYTFLERLETIYFSKVVSKYDESFKKQVLKKTYLIDNWFMTAISFKFSDNYGKLLENTVFTELYRTYWDQLFFLKNWSETDFILNTPKKSIYQVCYELNEENEKREIKWCIDAMKKFSLQHSTIISFEQERDINTEEGKIHVIPFYKWILEK